MCLKKKISVTERERDRVRFCLHYICNVLFEYVYEIYTYLKCVKESKKYILTEKNTKNNASAPKWQDERKFVP